MEAEQLKGDEPIDLGEGRARELEPVLAEDVDKICKFNKDALRVFALKKFGLNLDLSSHIAIIRGDLIKKSQIALGQILADADTDEATREAIEKVIPMYVMHPKTLRVFDSTPALLKKLDMIPCTKDGRPLKSNEYFIPVDKPQYKPNSGSEMERIAAGMEKQIER